jgi:hypothetical protein
VNILYCLEEWRGEQRISTPGGEVFPFIGAKLRMGLWKVNSQVFLPPYLLLKKYF